MIEFFAELGRAVLERWKRENFSLTAFPGIAVAALDDRPPALHVNLPLLMRDFLLSDNQPAQTDSDFGQPELVAYSHPRFYIQLLFWLEGTTAIHQHEFSGAFHVIQGTSIHAQYAFENDRAITPYLHIGSVRTKKIELMETGRTVAIVSGQQEIHSLFHLDYPSVTVVVRTQHDPGTGPQFNYLPPGLAIDPLHGDMLVVRRKQLLDVLERVEDPGYAGLVKEMIADLDFERGFYILQHGMDYLQRLGEWQPIITAFEQKHGPLAGGVAASLQEEARREAIQSLRSAITDPEHRFFLALLMNAPTRADLLALVSQRFSGHEPMATITRWAEEMMDVTDEGVAILDAMFPEALDVEFDEQPELFLAAFDYFLKGGKQIPPLLRALSETEIGELRSAFGKSTLSLLFA